MNTDEYIESGQIETCLMGAVTEPEAEVLEGLRLENADINSEAFNIEVLLEDLAFAHRLNPNPWLKDRLINRMNWGNSYFF